MSCVAWSRPIGHGTQSRADRLDVDVSLMRLVDWLITFALQNRVIQRRI